MQHLDPRPDGVTTPGPHIDGSPAPVLRVMTLGAHTLFVLLLAVGVARCLADGPVAAVVLAGVVLGWYLLGVWFARMSAAATGRDWYGQFWLGVLVLGWLVLAVVSVNFVWVAFALYFLCFHVLTTRVAVAATVAINAVVIAASLWHGGTNVVATFLGPTFGAAAAAGMALVYQQLLRDAAQRRRLFDELTRSHAELLDAQDELAALQREAGAVDERARLARDIHDTLAQGFSSIVLLARAGGRSEDPAPILAQIAATAQENLGEARRVVAALTPSALDDASLESALRRLLAELGEHTGIVGELVVDGEPARLPMDYDVALLRVAQSALANVRLHSQARQVRVTLSYAPDEVRLDVVDDGIGFEPDGEFTPASFGLRSMRERLDSFGGSLVVESAPGDGTALAATLPTGRVS
ncbi:sensor histidine kinase [Rhodococcus kronopolitis]|uniref:Sensor histidine kinase n=1 Tax=Rhodococcus kronopolitis TaxID=1460226 RepID=A0ABV9FUG8_9NOCA